jgi:CelD/BcsL family acetyltransferase involved in cellulose biosynthesis
MNIRIQEMSQAETSAWDQIWRNCDYATYFHSLEWAEIWASYTKGKIHPDPLLFTFSDGRTALLPLSSQRGRFGIVKSYFSSPAGTFGGWISEDDLYSEHAELLLDFMTKKIGNVVWRVNPYDPLSHNLEMHNAINDQTHVIDLLPGFDDICKKSTSGHRRAVNKALREGVSIRLASSEADWHAYYHTYEDSLQRWGAKASSVYDWAFFNAIFQMNSPYIKLWLAMYKDAVISGALIFYAKKHVVYWHGAALATYFHLRPSNLLLYEAIKDACEKGYSWFDFNPSGGHEGVTAFKKSFGATVLQSQVVNIRSRGYRFLQILGSIPHGYART